MKIIDKIVNSIARKFRFAYYSEDDLKQEGRILALEALNGGKYDPTRPLENFLYSHVRNRLGNFKRDNYIRHEPPCKVCPFYDPKNLKSAANNKCAAFVNKNDCDKWDAWEKRNAAKKSVIEPIYFSVAEKDQPYDVPSSSEDIVDDIAFREILQIINEKLPVDLRADYLRLRQKDQHNKVSKQKTEKVREAVRQIIKEYNEI